MPEDYNFDDIVDDEEMKEEFCEWFWTGKVDDITNSDNLIQFLNTSKYRSTDYVRKEMFRPCIYGVLLKYKFHRNWKFIKIGFTHRKTKKVNSRMTTVERKIEKSYGEGKAKTLFVLPIDPIDTRSFNEVQVYVRKIFGYRINKDLATTLSFPFSTEWVMTTQEFIDIIREKIDVAKSKRNANTSVFEGLQFDPKTRIPKRIYSSRKVTEWNRMIITHRDKTICLRKAQTKKHGRIIDSMSFSSRS